MAKPVLIRTYADISRKYGAEVPFLRSEANSKDFSGSWDVLVPASRHADVFDEALTRAGVEHKYEKYFGVPHGIGLGKRTKAQGWLERAVEYWG